MTEYAIEARDVAVTYADGTEAVRGVDLLVETGEFFGFLGPNGAGKTTLIKTLVTLLRPTDGTVTVNGFDAVAEPQSVRATVGYMAQETSIDPELTARENLRFACDAYGVSRAERGDRIDELLALVELTDVADKVADDFSGGMKKRLDAATALVHRPPLVFLDEPTTGLDPAARNRLWEYFQRINDEGTTVFLTTQYLEEADQLCDRLSVIQDGSVVADGTPETLKRRVGGEILDVELAEPAESERAVAVARDESLFAEGATITPTESGLTVTARDARTRGTDLLVALRDADIGVVGFDVRAPTLDDVFLAVTGERTEAAAADGGDVQAEAVSDGGDAREAAMTDDGETGAAPDADGVSR
ncbi:ABC transporter ATP-binding protein [Natrinema hispanicum]|uniref:ABC-2 type transport system ATP-binding protein n=1 Tax=Natrinema hispanicum TaxID=392421 RepID=A0A1G6N4T0_9EURY|nr:ABC transporter ATP-binding protein [Natrinema hispanicum]SDC62454.1 ABC-2 type transport system ATP-binding protein [Natrinema hispanicum]SET82496.1 ABC-2 type transport system ATP-binding protein [Natrinema hispanicum]